MKKYLMLIGITGLLFSRSGGSMAQPDPFRMSGELMTDQRIRLHDPYAWSWSENRLRLGFSKDFREKAGFESDIWVRSFGFPFLTRTEQLFNKDLTSPYNIDIRELYIDLYGFLSKKIDLRLGRQVITWGRGDRLNPTRNLNPLDLEDIWDFGRYHGVDAMKLTAYLGEISLEAVYVPFFRPATLPMGDFSAFFTQEIVLPQGVNMTSFSDTLMMPSLSVGQSGSAGLLLGGFLAGFDLSASYVYGRDGLPMVSRNIVKPVGPGDVSIRSELLFPRTHILGADFAGSLGSLGIWGEMAVFLPKEEIRMVTDLSSLGQPSLQETTLAKEPYFKYLLGTDFTFRDGSYLNIQFLHGFAHERGRGNLDDYLVMSYEKELFSGRLKISPLAGALIISSWESPADDHTLVYTPSICYKPNDNTELTLGTRVIGGRGQSAFTRLKDMDEFFFRLRYSF